MYSNYSDYDLLQDRIMHTYSGLEVRVNVKLYHQSTQSEDNMKYFYHEFLRNARIGGAYRKNSVMIRRDIDAYLTIVLKSYSTGVDVYANIYPKSMNELQLNVQSITQALMSPSNWYKKNGKLRVKADVRKTWSIDLGYNRFLTFNLITLIDANEQSSKGIRIWIETEDKFLDISYDDFMEFSYFILHMDLLGCAQRMTLQLNIPHGTNQITMESTQPVEDSVTLPIDKELEIKETESSTRKAPTLAEQLRRANKKELTLDDM